MSLIIDKAAGNRRLWQWKEFCVLVTVTGITGRIQERGEWRYWISEVVGKGKILH